MSVDEMLSERLKRQGELQLAYPELTAPDRAKIRTFNDYAYFAHDEAEFLFEAIAEIRSMHESHFMTRKNKELIKEKKALEEALSLAKSMGPQDSEAVEHLRT